MKETFIRKVFNAKHEALIRTAESIMTRYSAAGYDLSLRQLYYQFVAHHGLANTEQNYKLLGNVISDARDAGRLDWETMVDRGRVATIWATYDDPADLIASSRYRYAVKMWENQPWHVELMVEKQALEGVLRPVASRMQVIFNANKGYSSASAMYKTGKRLEEARDNGKNVAIIYLGDHDPSGIDMSRDVHERLELYSRGEVECVRVALNMDQVEEYNPPPNPTKLTDSRAVGYIDRFGMECWELDALDPEVLATLSTEAIRKYIDDDQWDADRARFKVDIAKIDRLVEAYRNDELDEVLGDVEADESEDEDEE